MLAKVVGKKRKNGTWQHGDYDNTYINVLFEEAGVEGCAVDSIKQKTTNVADIAVGDTVEIIYNRFGDVDKIFKKEE